MHVPKRTKLWWMLELLKLGMMMAIIIFGYTLSAIANVSIICALLVVPAIHEAGHFYWMRKFDIPIEKVGIGIPFGPFKHLQYKFKPVWLQPKSKVTGRRELGESPTELWISPLFFFMAYVEEGERGREAISKLDREQRALIYGSGVANNLVTALALFALLRLVSTFENLDLTGLLEGLAIAVVATVLLAIRDRRPEGTPIRRASAVTALAVVAMLWLAVRYGGGIFAIPVTTWLLACWAFATILVVYRPVIISRWFPLVGLATAVWLCWEILPNVWSDFNYATRMGGASPGETATIIGTRSLLDLLGSANGEMSDHLTQLLGPAMASIFTELGQSWNYAIIMSLVTSVGFASANLLPIKSTDGGLMWGDALDPNQNRPKLRRWGVGLPTAVLIPFMVGIFIRTDFGDVALFACVAITLVYGVRHFVSSRENPETSELQTMTRTDG